MTSPKPYKYPRTRNHPHRPSQIIHEIQIEEKRKRQGKINFIIMKKRGSYIGSGKTQRHRALLLLRAGIFWRQETRKFVKYFHLECFRQWEKKRIHLKRPLSFCCQKERSNKCKEMCMPHKIAVRNTYTAPRCNEKTFPCSIFWDKQKFIVAARPTFSLICMLREDT